jgi:uncharacterized protein YoxC
MATPVQIALFFACVAIVVFVIGFVIALVQLQRRLEQTTRTIEELKTDVKLLVDDTRKLMQSMNALTERANRQCGDVERVVGTVRGWSERADRVFQEVSAAVEPPLLLAARNLQLFRTGFAAFVQALLHRNPDNQPKKEVDHG